MSESSENIYDLNKSIKSLINANILGNSISEIALFIEERKCHDTVRISKTVQDLSYNLKNVVLLSKSKNKFYYDRQTMIIRKQCIIDDLVWLSKDLAILKEKEIRKYKFGNNTDGIKPSNDTERKILMESNLSQYQYCISILDNHISFLTETIKNISDMTFGHELVLKLEEYQKL